MTFEEVFYGKDLEKHSSESSFVDVSSLLYDLPLHIALWDLADALIERKRDSDTLTISSSGDFLLSPERKFVLWQNDMRDYEGNCISLVLAQDPSRAYRLEVHIDNTNYEDDEWRSVVYSGTSPEAALEVGMDTAVDHFGSSAYFDISYEGLLEVVNGYRRQIVG